MNRFLSRYASSSAWGSVEGIGPFALKVAFLACTFSFYELPATPQGPQSLGSAVRLVTPAIQKPVRRDARALSIVQTALGNLGGEANISGISSLDATGHYGKTAVTTFEWQSSGTNMRLVFHSPSGVFETNSGNGTPFTRSEGASRRIAQEVGRFTFVPIALAPLLYASYQDNVCSIEYLGSKKLGEESVDVVQTIQEATPQTALASHRLWYFSTTTGLPVQLDYREFALKWPLYRTTSYTYAAFSASGGVLFPRQVTVAIPGKSQATVTVTALTLNQSVPADAFNLPQELTQ
jgi:hypothetical protein